MLLRQFPIDQFQPRHPREFRRIVRDQCEVMLNCYRSDHHIVRAYWKTNPLEMCANPRIFNRRSAIVRHNDEKPCERC